MGKHQKKKDHVDRKIVLYHTVLFVKINQTGPEISFGSPEIIFWKDSQLR